MAEVAVLGLGRMGTAAAQRLASGGFRVSVWNRTSAVARELAEASSGDVVPIADPAEAVRNAEVVLSFLASGDASRSVLLDTGVVDALRDKAVICDLGTSGVDAVREIGAALSGARRRFVDAPVSGSVPAVEAGTLLVMAGGEPSDIELARPVLDRLAKAVIRVGDVGAGQAMKLAVNMIVHDLNLAVSEALKVAEGAGIARENAYGVLEQSVVAAPFLNYKRPAYLEPDTAVAMSIDLVAKDLLLALELAASVGVGVPFTQAAQTVVETARRAGFGARDMADLSRFSGGPDIRPNR